MAAQTLGARLAASCGILYPVLLIVGDDVIAGGDKIAPDAGAPEEVLANLAAIDSTTFLTGRAIGLLSLVCLLVFTAYLASLLRRVFGVESMLPYLALGAGAMGATLQFTAAIAHIALVRHGTAGLSPEMAVLLLDFGAGFLLAMAPYGVLLLAVAAAGIRGQVVGRVIGWVGGALGVALLIGFVAATAGVGIGFLPMPLSWLWFIAAGISTLRRAGATTPAPTPAFAPAS